ncbi:LysR family transcriptional regulator [Geobacillus sp. YF-1]|uniref:LysR family transcriptional regulator n=1 Tax=Geobacillus sp. YF-1 TaxID=3457480 RepID=UPI004045F069
MNSSEYEILAVLAEELNMRKAAARLYVTQSALSQRLQAIEAGWNVKIFIRSQRGLLLTPEGEKIVQLAKETVQKTKRVKEEIQRRVGQISGTLTIAVTSIVAQHWLPPVLKTFIKLYPDVNVSLTTGWTSEVLSHMYENRFQLGIVRGEPNWSGIATRLFSDQLYLVDQEIHDLEQLRHTERPFIQFKSDSTYSLHIQQWWHEQFQALPARTVMVDQIETCKQLAYHGVGYAILPEIALDDREQYVVHMIPLKNKRGEPMTRDTWLISSEAAWQLPQVQAFEKVLRRFVP